MTMLRCGTSIGAVLALVCIACTTTTGTDPAGGGVCAGDAACPTGQECTGAGCVPSRPTIFSHIQLASAFFRAYNDNAEMAWRATHADLLIGGTILESQDLRAANPNVRLVPYFTNRYHHLDTEAAEWCATYGANPEDFYLHYREDVVLPGYNTVLVPGYPVGVVPGWNPNWQAGDPPASAANRAESRAFGLYDPSHQPWYLANFNHPSYRDFAKDYIRTLVDGTVWGSNGDPFPADAVLMDHGVYYPEFNEGDLPKTDEFYGIPLDDNHPYGVAFETFYPELEGFLAGVFSNGVDVVPNFGHAHFLSRTDRFSQSIQSLVDWAWGEVWITHYAGASPTEGANRVVTYDKDYERGIANMVRQSRTGKRRILGARDLTNGLAGTDRGRLFTLALYYLVSNPNTFLAFETANSHRNAADISQWQWNPAVQVDIGRPAPVPPGYVDFEGRPGSVEHYVFAEGRDPYDPGLTYRVLARRFTNGLVLVKMLPEGSVVDDRSYTVHPLGQSYRLVSGAGVIGSITTSVVLRNNEAVILVNP
jgi:hypothetical protein